MDMFGSYSFSIFFARFLGLYLLIAFLLFVLRKDDMKALVKKVTDDSGLLAVTGIISLFVGIAVVVTHSIFVSDWRVIVTLLGYFMVVKGIMRVGFPKNANENIRKMGTGTNWLVTQAIMLVLGLVLVYFGFSL